MKSKKTSQKSKIKKKQSSPYWKSKNIFYTLIIIAVLATVYFLFIIKPSENLFKKEGEVTFFKKENNQKNLEIDVEVANNNTERMRGLMFRKEMDEDNGMLFIFEKPDTQSFWMKNTILPLDIMFIDSAGVIDTIYRSTTPYSERSLPSRRRVQFVVEVNAGWSDKFGVKEGDLIEFKVDK